MTAGSGVHHPGIHTNGADTHDCEAGRISWQDHLRWRRRGWWWGGVAATGLSVAYVIVLALANSLQHVVSQFVSLWPWMTSLVLGFGVQFGLHGYVRAATAGKSTPAAASAVASGGASTVSMVACCAHHLIDVLPAMGIAGAAVFLAQYQSLFLLLGVLSNTVATVYLLGAIRRHGLYPSRRSLLSLSVAWPVHHAFRPVLVGAIVVLLIAVGATVL